MTNQVIGKVLTNGYAGTFSRQPDTIIDTQPLLANETVGFGLGVIYDATNADGTISKPISTSVAGDFVGVAVREVKSATNYINQDEGAYNGGDAVPVLKRGCVNVLCQNGTPTFDGDVYLRIAANASLPNCVVGGFEAAADSTNSVKLTNVKWKGTKDANGVAEIRILETLHA